MSSTSSTSVIDDPFQLANYSFSNRAKAKKPSPNHIFATHHQKRSSSKGEGYVTVSAQTDGIHILDVSTLHPIIAHTLGPSTSFSCPSITFPSSSGDVNVYTTYAVIESSPEFLGPDEGGRTIWKWNGNTSSISSTTESQKKISKVVVPPQQRIHGLYSSAELPAQLLVVTSTGELLILDTETLDQKASSQAEHHQPLSTVLQTFVFSSTECQTTVPPSSSGAAVLAIATSDASSSLRLQILSVDEEGVVNELQWYEFPQKRDQIADLSCSPSGCFTILCKDGTWHAYKIMLSPNSSSPTPSTPTLLSNPFQLAKFALPSHSTPQPITILSLTSSHILLAGISSSEITIHIWDLQYSILLASHAFSIPSAFASSPLTLKLVAGSSPSPSPKSSKIRGQAILILSQPPSADWASQRQSITSSVLVVPYVVPETSTIAAALGRAPSSKVWMKANSSNTAESSQKKTPQETARETLVGTIRSAVEAGNGKAAETAFFAWVKAESENAKEGDQSGQDSASPSPAFGYTFVKQLVDAVFAPANAGARASSTYPQEILKYLLERRVLSNGMVEGGLLKTLAARNDWSSIELCFSHVIDLPESDIIALLRTVVAHQRQNQRSASEDAMQVDPAPSGTSIPLLPDFLAFCVNYPTTAKPLILAIRKHLREAEDVICVEQTLETWIRTISDLRKANGELLLPNNKDLEKNEHGVWIVNTKRKEGKRGKKKSGSLPALDMIITFLQSLMDASFLTLLQHAPAHKLLQQLQQELEAEAAFAEVLELLRGPLEPFAISHQKTLKEAAIPEKEKERQKQKVDWRQRRNANHGGGDVGLYQLEELVI